LAGNHCVTEGKARFSPLPTIRVGFEIQGDIMSTIRHSGASLAVVALLALAGCSTDGNAGAPTSTPLSEDVATGSAQNPTGNDHAAALNPGDSAARFVACLHADGIEATIFDGNFVMVPAPEAKTLTADNGFALMQITDGSGSWVAPLSAEFFADDALTHDAWLACEVEVPGFTQPTTPAHADQIAQVEPALAFAQRARDAGFAWVADPEPNMPGITIPEWVDATELRAMLEAAWDPDNAAFMFAMETNDPEMGQALGAVIIEFIQQVRP